MNPMVPVINLNGKSKESHMRDYQAVIDALRDAMTAMQEVRPHGRDYQTVRGSFPEGLGFSMYSTHLDVYNQRFSVLDKLCNEFQDDLYAIYKQ